MIKIKLINMPFADIAIPSIALTQLKSVTETVLKDKVEIDIHYLNHDFGDYLEVDNYRFMSLGGQSNNSGFGDWFFRQQAFPEEPDNTEDYLTRYGSLLGFDFLKEKGEYIQQKRQGLDVYMDGLIDQYELADADIVGFTSMFMQNIASLAMVRKIKQRNKDIIAIMGGANCETPMGEEIVKNFDIVDYVFSGTALISFPKFVNSIMSGNRSQAESINGVFSKANSLHKEKVKAKVLVKEDGEVETVGPIGDEFSINECVPLNYDSFLASFDRYFKDSTVKPYLLFETSRGCWWGAKAHCTFCGLNGGGMSYRAMKDEAAIAMINDLFDRYSDRVKHFSCVDNIIPREYIKGVFPYTKRKEGVTIFYEVRADLRPEEMEILSDAGVVEMQPGIESLATSTLKLMKKGTTAFNNIRFLQNTVVYSIVPHWNLLVGFPGEDEGVYEKYCHDMPLLQHLPPPSGVFPVRFDRYSPYFTEADKYELDLVPLDYYSYTYSISSESMKEMAYYFSDQNYDAEYIRITGKWLSKLQKGLQAWKERWADSDNTSFPKLYMSKENGVDVVIDERTDETKTVKLSEEEKDVLINLDSKKNFAGLERQMRDLISPESLKSAVDYLLSNGLLFEENGTLMSIVFKEKPVLKVMSRHHS